MLTPPLGAPIAVTSDALIIGRRPSADPDFPDAQLVPISDETRTMSKTHARLELLGDEWVIVDLDSTNGVVLFRDDGAETEATPGVPSASASGSSSGTPNCGSSRRILGDGGVPVPPEWDAGATAPGRADATVPARDATVRSARGARTGGAVDQATTVQRGGPRARRAPASAAPVFGADVPRRRHAWRRVLIPAGGERVRAACSAR